MHGFSMQKHKEIINGDNNWIDAYILPFIFLIKWINARIDQINENNNLFDRHVASNREWAIVM
jgi:hypothetical protein